MSEQAAERLSEQIRGRVAEAQAAQTRYVDGLSAIVGERRDAGPSFRAGAAGEPAVTVLTDRALPDETRVEVLERLGAQLSRRADFVEACLGIVRDRDDSPAVRQAVLDELASAAFQVARFRPHRQAYDDALRDLLDDPVTALRETATATLAQRHDPATQQILADGLQNDGPLPVDRVQAVLLLAEDDHLDNLPRLTELYQHDSPDAREQAVRFMGSYPDAEPMLESVMRDKGEAPSVREQSVASLRHLAPGRAETVAKEIVMDPTDDPEVRTACLATLQHLGDAARTYGDEEFMSRVREVGAEEPAPELAQVARDFLQQERRP